MSAVAASFAVGGLATLGGAALTSRAASSGAKTMSGSANEAARLRAKSAAAQLAFAKQQAAQLRADTAYAQKANYGLDMARIFNEGGRFNISTGLAADSTNATGENIYNRFAATREDDYRKYAARTSDMSNLRAMIGGQTYDPAPLSELAEFERVKAEQYDPTIPDYVPNPNLPPPGTRS